MSWKTIISLNGTHVYLGLSPGAAVEQLSQYKLEVRRRLAAIAFIAPVHSMA